MSAEKQAIRAAFGKAAAAYDAFAEVQRRIARQLLIQTPPALSILDAGCGTGFGVQLLRAAQADASILALDSALPMCARLASPAVVCGDIEALPLADGCLDLYWSSLAWQWTRPELAAAEAARVLAQGGHLRVASLGPGTLSELRKAFSALDTYNHVRAFHTLEHHAGALQAAGFSDVRITRCLEQTHAPDLRSILRDIRSLGAHQLDGARRPGMIGRQSWQKLQTAYEAFRTREGLPVSYDVFYLSATKP